MRERHLTFKDAVNQAIVAGLTGPADRPRVTWPTYDMGEPLMDITKALRLAGELEDEHILDQMGRDPRPAE